ncbi:MAG: hypothetical protein ACOC0P_06190 [Planctomycetota bacterium]
MGIGKALRREIVWAQSRLPEWLNARGGQYELVRSACHFTSLPIDVCCDRQRA